MPKPKDDLAQARRARKLRDDLRALQAQYPELTSPAAQRRLEEYLQAEIAKEDTMPGRGDRMLGEDLTILTFRVPKSALQLIDTHMLRMQQASRWVKIGRADAQRDIFLRGLDQVDALPEPVRPAPPVELELPLEPNPAAAPQLPLPTPPLVEPAATSAGGAIPPAPAYEARVLTPEVPPEAPLEHPLDLESADTPLELAVDVTQESVVPAVAVETVKPPKSRKTARSKAVATPTPKTPRTPKGRK